VTRTPEKTETGERAPGASPGAAVTVDLPRLLARQRDSFLREGPPDLQGRRDRLDRLRAALLHRADDVVSAVTEDYGCRSRHEILLSDVWFPASHMKYSGKRLRRWMRPERRKVDAAFFPGRAWLEPQPKGVVGIISPWNYPVSLALVPLVAALAAGNRVLLKPSEITPASAELLRDLLASVFPEEEVAVVTGGPEVGHGVASLPLDHLLFTGSTGVGREVARLAAGNLVPVTLELGGKSPAILHPSFPLDTAVRRIVAGKLMNSGQTCVAPDYLLVEQDSIPRVVEALGQRFRESVPRPHEDPDYASIVNDRHADRIRALIADAAERGARIVPLCQDASHGTEGPRTLLPTLVLDVPEGARILEEEIFGPVLPVLGYRTLDEAIERVRGAPRPLALYYFDHDRDRVRHVLERTWSGGAGVNDVVYHAAMNDLSFGGIGESGMGSYHGIEGFQTFSHRRPVFRRGRFALTDHGGRPYGSAADRLIRFLLRSVR